MDRFKLVCLSLLPMLAAIGMLGCGEVGRDTSGGAAHSHVDQKAQATVKSVEEVEGVTAQEVLAKLRKAYAEADVYVDNAMYYERSVYHGEGIEHESLPHLVAVIFERPNKFHLRREVPDATSAGLKVEIVSNGKKLRGYVSDIPQQVLEQDATEKPTSMNIAPDDELAMAVMPVPMENLFPQLDLLLDEESAPCLFAHDKQAKLLKSEEWEGKPCYRVRATGGHGAKILWIDKEEGMLRRVEIPTGEILPQIDPQKALSKLELWIDLHDASTKIDVPSSAFELEVPAEAKRVEKLVRQKPEEPEENDTDELPKTETKS